MARNKPGQKMQVQQLVRQRQAQRISNHKTTPFECTTEIEVEDEETGEKHTEVCGCILFDQKMLYDLGLIPEVICGVKNGAVQKTPHEHFICVRCGTIYAPADWKKAIRAQYEEKQQAGKIDDPAKPKIEIAKG